MARKIIRECIHHLSRECYCGTICVAFTICVQKQQTIFIQHQLVKDCISILDLERTKHNCMIPMYSFLPDHLHLMVSGNNEQADSYQLILDFKKKLGFYLSKKQCPYRLQQDFYDHIIQSPKELAAQLRYIAENAVRRGLVMEWQDYPFTGSLGIAMQDVIEIMISDG